MSDEAKPADAAGGSAPGGAAVDTAGIVFLGVYFAVTALLLIYLFLKFWPTEDCFRPGAGAACAGELNLFFGWLRRPLALEKRLFVIVALSGAIGAYVHALTSFGDYVGNRQLVWSWVWWLVLRAPIGASLAVVLYLVLRGGLLGPSGSDGHPNPYGFAAVAALSGMFSVRVTDKLKEVFDTFFKTNKDVGRGDPLQLPAPAAETPAIDSLAPASAKAGAADIEITVKGKGFRQASRIMADGSVIATAFVSEAELKGTLKSALLSAARPLSIVVQNPRPGGSSRPATFTVE